MRKSLGTLLAVVGTLALVGPALAHHGVAAYQTDKNVTVEGKVTEFYFSNPHAVLALDVKDAQGNVMEWQCELTSPNHLVRAGWTSKTLKPGDRITVSGYPAKSGAGSMWIRKIAKANGQVLSTGSDGDS
jgi:hypothetical protein